MIYSFIPITKLKVQILSPSDMNSQIREQLVNYKRRWNESVASNVQIISDISECDFEVPLIAPSYMDDLPENTHLVNSIGELTHYDLRRHCIESAVHQFTCIDEFMLCMQNLPATISCDFEAASMYTDEEKLLFKEQLELVSDTSVEGIALRQKINSSGLSHPKLVRITHISIATSETESYVLAMTKDMEIPICEWLAAIPNLQVWHNISFDGKLLYDRVGKLPKAYDDTMLMWWTILNNADTTKAKVGLKTLAYNVYGNWGNDIKDQFNLKYLYSEELIYYAGIDTQACLYLHTEVLAHQEFQDENLVLIPINKLLPLGNPKNIVSRNSRKFFYYNVVKSLIEPTVKLMMQGITINSDNVNNLRETITEVLAKVDVTLANNITIQKFQSYKYSMLKKDYIAERKSKQRSITYYTKPYKADDIVHRSFLVNYILLQYPNTVVNNKARLPTGQLKWTVSNIKKIDAVDSLHVILAAVIDKHVNPNDNMVKQAMITLAITKSNIYNAKYNDDITTVSQEKILPKFNPGSSLQKLELFEFLGIPCEQFSKLTKLASWSRSEVTRVNKLTNNKDVKELTQAFIDHSFSAIIKANFIAAFDTFTVDGKLYGNYKLMGAKSG